MRVAGPPRSGAPGSAGRRSGQKHLGHRLGEESAVALVALELDPRLAVVFGDPPRDRTGSGAGELSGGERIGQRTTRGARRPARGRVRRSRDVGHVRWRTTPRPPAPGRPRPGAAPQRRRRRSGSPGPVLSWADRSRCGPRRAAPSGPSTIRGGSAIVPVGAAAGTRSARADERRGRTQMVRRAWSTYGVPTAQAARMSARCSARSSMCALVSPKVVAGGVANGEKSGCTCATPSTTSPVSSTPK